MGLLDCKKIVITGIISKKSIAYGIAEQCYKQGAQLILTYQNDRFRERLEEIAEEFGQAATFPCDVSDEAQIDELFQKIAGHTPTIDGLVHAIAYAPRTSISGSFMEGCDRSSFQTAQDISSYSLIALTRQAAPLMTNGGSIVTLTYLGSQRSVVNYNTMGLAKASLEAGVRYLASELGSKNIRVNSISAGPIKTLAASGIEGFSHILKHTALASPLKRNMTLGDIGGAAAFLLSQLSSGITGEILYVDGGYRTVLPLIAS